MDPEKMSATGMTLDGREHTVSLEHVVRFAIPQTVTGWRSPAAGDCKMRISNPEMADKRLASGKQISLELEAHGAISTSSPAATAKRGALNPAHSRWLMGYPAAWDSCGATAMQSSRKERQTSSKPPSKPSLKIINRKS